MAFIGGCGKTPEVTSPDYVELSKTIDPAKRVELLKKCPAVDLLSDPAQRKNGENLTMRMPIIFKSAVVPLLIWLALFTVNAHAAIDNVGILNNVLDRYQVAASTWTAAITAHATWLFWTLALISMVWTFGQMALRKADIGEFFAEFIRFIVFTGFFWWLLLNGPRFATSIMDSLRKIGGEATGSGGSLTPSGIVDIGFGIFSKVLDYSSVLSPVDSAIGIIMSAIVLVILALIGVNMLLLLISGWILAYAGIFFLGFGGSRWTSEMAINYFKTVLNIAAQLFTMVLLVGIGKSFIDQYYNNMSSGIILKELGVMLIVAVVLLKLVNTIPPLIGGLAGGQTGSLGNGFGAGAAIAAAAMGAAAAASVGAAMATGATNMAGGAQAVMAAFSQANASESAGGGSTGDLMAAAGGGGDSGSGGGSSVLASAMGDSGPAGSTDFGSANNLGGGEIGGASASSDAKGTDNKAGGAPGEQESGGALAAAAAAAAKAGRIAAGTATNLAQGSWDVAKEKAGDMKDAAMDRISETTGGKIAAAIKARDVAPDSNSSSASTFDNNSLSSGANSSTDATSEIAAFRDRTQPT